MIRRLTLLLGIILLPAVPAFSQSASQSQEPPNRDRDNPGTPADEAAARREAAEILAGADPEIARDDAVAILTTIASNRYEGRGTGLRGERKVTAFIAEWFGQLELAPAGDDETFFQKFPFPLGVKMGTDNHAKLVWEAMGGNVPEAGGADSEEVKNQSIVLQPDVDYLPLAFSTVKKKEEKEEAETPEKGKKDQPRPVVFVGFGIQGKDYDSFAGLDVKDKWIAAFRGVPEKDGNALRAGGPLIAKAKLAKKLEAAGILYIRGFNDKISSELVPLSTPLGREKILPALSISNALAEKLLTGASTDGHEGLETIYRKYADRESVAGFPTDVHLSAEIDLEPVTGHGRNVLARLQVGDQPSEQVVVIGGHADHVGFGNRGGSMAKGLTANRIHPGADDNASGISALLEIAQHLSDLHKRGELDDAKRDIVFAAWTGEEMGLIGSRFWVSEAKKSLGKDNEGDKENDKENDSLQPKVAAYLNLDMVGRVRENKLKIQGTGSSSIWPGLVEASAGSTTLDLIQEANPILPTDVAAFNAARVPVLAAYSDRHPQWHTPGDTTDKVNFDGLIEAADFMAEILRKVAAAEEAPEFVKFERKRPPKVLIGFVPKDTGSGIAIAQVSPGSPAENAGLQAGDLLLSLNQEPVTDLATLQKIVAKLAPDKEYPMRIRRGGGSQTLTIVPLKR